MKQQDTMSKKKKVNKFIYPLASRWINDGFNTIATQSTIIQRIKALERIKNERIYYFHEQRRSLCTATIESSFGHNVDVPIGVINKITKQRGYKIQADYIDDLIQSTLPRIIVNLQSKDNKISSKNIVTTNVISLTFLTFMSSMIQIICIQVVTKDSELTDTQQNDLHLLENLRLAEYYRRIELYKIYTPVCIENVVTDYLERNGFHDFEKDVLILIYQYAFSPEISMIIKREIPSSLTNKKVCWFHAMTELNYRSLAISMILYHAADHTFDLNNYIDLSRNTDSNNRYIEDKRTLFTKITILENKKDSLLTISEELVIQYRKNEWTQFISNAIQTGACLSTALPQSQREEIVQFMKENKWNIPETFNQTEYPKFNVQNKKIYELLQRIPIRVITRHTLQRYNALSNFSYFESMNNRQKQAFYTLREKSFDLSYLFTKSGIQSVFQEHNLQSSNNHANHELGDCISGIIDDVQRVDNDAASHVRDIIINMLNHAQCRFAIPNTSKIHDTVLNEYKSCEQIISLETNEIKSTIPVLSNGYIDLVPLKSRFVYINKLSNITNQRAGPEFEHYLSDYMLIVFDLNPHENKEELKYYLQQQFHNVTHQRGLKVHSSNRLLTTLRKLCIHSGCKMNKHQSIVSNQNIILNMYQAFDIFIASSIFHCFLSGLTTSFKIRFTSSGTTFDLFVIINHTIHGGFTYFDDICTVNGNSIFTDQRNILFIKETLKHLCHENKLPKRCLEYRYIYCKTTNSLTASFKRNIPNTFNAYFQFNQTIGHFDINFYYHPSLKHFETIHGCPYLKQQYPVL